MNSPVLFYVSSSIVMLALATLWVTDPIPDSARSLTLRIIGTVFMPISIAAYALQRRSRQAQNSPNS